MQNRVGSVIPSDQDIQRLIKDVENVSARIEKFTLNLSAEERRHTTKMRANGDRIVELVGNLAAQHEVSLPRISVEDMKDDLTLAQRLAPLAKALEEVSQTVADTILPGAVGVLVDRDGVLLGAHAPLGRRPEARGRAEAGGRVLRTAPAERAARARLICKSGDEPRRQIPRGDLRTIAMAGSRVVAARVPGAAPWLLRACPSSVLSGLVEARSPRPRQSSGESHTLRRHRPASGPSNPPPRTRRLVRHILTLEAIGWRVVELRPLFPDGDAALWHVRITRVDLDASMSVSATDPEIALAEIVRYASADATENH